MFKYYKRGEGELDTSNFHEILAAGELTIECLDEKTFMSLLALDQFYSRYGDLDSCLIVRVNGYVAHLRADKDVFNSAGLYHLLQNLKIECAKIQHESNGKVKSATIDAHKCYLDLDLACKVYQCVGADKSVQKFISGFIQCADKQRTDGKVVGLTFDAATLSESCDIIIVDDILGGGATVQMLVDLIREAGLKNNIHLWVQYNEGIHTYEFLNQFDSYYTGDQV